MENNGSDKLIAGILEDAHKNAAAIEQKADDDVAAIRDRLNAERDALHLEYREKAAALREDSIRRAKTNAELEGRKELLKKKRALIDEAYSRANLRLTALSGKEREGLLLKLLKSECEGGETVCPAKKDRAMLEKLIPLCGVSGLKLGPDAACTDGFILTGSNFVKNCSFASLLDEVRGETTETVAKLLFK